jgi:DNA-binding NtrC family response regulator
MTQHIPKIKRGSDEITTEDFSRWNLVGKSPAFLRALQLIQKIASYDATVLIEGETGTGRELAARAIHYLGNRRDFPFIPVNYGALPDSLLENELYGHERGAFTDAKELYTGIITQAQHGTLFLDEVESMSARAQVVLLRFLQDHEYRPVGAKRIYHADVRIIGASNTDLQALTRAGHLRQDLLFRLNVLSAKLPPLRERNGDAALLAEYFIKHFSSQYGQPIKYLHPDTVSFLNSYDWPGNVREIENLIHREFLFTEGPAIRIMGLGNSSEDRTTNSEGTDPAAADEVFKIAKAKAIAQFERSYLAAMLSRAHGNISLAARLAGQERSTFRRLIKKHGLHLVWGLTFEGGEANSPQGLGRKCPSSIAQFFRGLAIT